MVSRDEIFAWIDKEAERQREGVELIASENYVSEPVLRALGSILTNKYAEGLPGKRYYGGCEFVDEIESLAISRACRLFGCSLCACTASFWCAGECGGDVGIFISSRHFIGF